MRVLPPSAPARSTVGLCQWWHRTRHVATVAGLVTGFAARKARARKVHCARWQVRRSVLTARRQKGPEFGPPAYCSLGNLHGSAREYWSAVVGDGYIGQVSLCAYLSARAMLACVRASMRASEQACVRVRFLSACVSFRAIACEWSGGGRDGTFDRVRYAASASIARYDHMVTTVVLHHGRPLHSKWETSKATLRPRNPRHTAAVNIQCRTGLAGTPAGRSYRAPRRTPLSGAAPSERAHS